MMSPRPARTVVEVSAPLEHYLIQVPPAGGNVCSICHGAVYDGYTMCYPCNEARRLLGDLGLDAASFVSLAPVGEQMARDLYTYKRPNVPSQLRAARTTGLSAALWRWLAKHERCVAEAADSSGFDLVTTVPSTNDRGGEHPLTALAGKIVVGTVDRVREVLALNRTDLAQHEHASDRFVASNSVQGLDILVIDDTWTKGANMQSASAALKQAGATRVGGVAIGRWFKTDYRDNATWLRDAKRRPWSWDTCCLE